ncbi:DUF4365 domain-containing protein [Gimesia aquarii]|uniref:DUF4365 domain-containing protein n=1 Tax=Gimesia aquarii TaxID=2527964 RepID=A0A517WXV1_9PLAN|nr:DUF4365 domain-containing protein [Gimesia aquarii]QDU10091.1 hypothetical protein V202x_34900 [Gimesia aquarii]
MAKRKQIGMSEITGEKGIALIHRIVLQMGFAWNPTNMDAGIDGYIELRDSETGEVSNCILQVQSKAGDSYFLSEDENSFVFQCKNRDLEYWLAGNAPVILVVSRPDKDEAYWISVKDYFSSPSARKNRRITFDKKNDRFERDCRHRLMRLAIPKNNGLYLSSLPQEETITSNLLPLVSIPERYFKSKTKFRDPIQVWEILRDSDSDPDGEWLLHNGFIYCFHDLTFEPWRNFCEPENTDNLRTTDLSNSERPSDRHAFVKLLNLCLTQLLYRQGIRYSKLKELYYFKASTDLTARKVGSKTVFKGYTSKKNESRIAYYRHQALEVQFLQIESKWYLELTPSYYFTHDGFKLSKYYEERLSGIKLLERQNKTHLSHLIMWSKILQQSYLSSAKQQSLQFEDDPTEDTIKPYSFLQFGPLVTFEVDFGISDSSWLPLPAKDNEEVNSRQKRLFD